MSISSIDNRRRDPFSRPLFFQQPLVLHSDNGSPMTGATLRETMNRLGVTSSYSRPGVSDDNAYAEALFRTCKYRPDYPAHGFATLDQARQWVLAFVRWYNLEHKHSGLKFISPVQRHTGLDAGIMERRRSVYEAAKARHPERWSRHTRNWDLPAQVWLNPTNQAEELTSAA